MNKIIITITSFVLALIIGFALLLPKHQAFIVLQSTIKEKETELQFQTEYFSKVKEASEGLGEYSESLGKITNALPETVSMPSLFNLLQTITGRTGLILENISLNSTDNKKQQRVKEVKAGIEVTGSYFAFKDFLGDLETSSRMINVESIAFFAPKDRGDPFSFSIEIKAQSY